MKKIVFLYTHPIQYFTPLQQTIHEKGKFKSKVLYCEDTSKGYYDREFGRDITWDSPLTEGYEFKVLKKSFISRAGSFFRFTNFGISSFLHADSTDILVVHGWSYFTALYAILLAKARGIKIWLRAESPLVHEKSRSKFSLILRDIIFKQFFKLIDGFLVIGKQNEMFYMQYGVNPSKFIAAPYSVNNNYFRSQADRLIPQKATLRAQKKIPVHSKVVLYSGKLIDKKRPLDLLRAFQSLDKDLGAFLVFVGDGELRKELELLIQKANISNVLITGFINQSAIPEYYAIADVFVMCSGYGETWGLSTNEAMSFGLPIVVSDMTGNFSDLVNGNGYVFKTGDVNDLSHKLRKLLSASESEIEYMKARSLEIIKNYSYDQVVESLNNKISAAN